jgi:hypothetical protein
MAGSRTTVRISRLSIIVSVILLGSVQALPDSKQSPKIVSLDGAYEFVSEVITYTKPERATERRDNSEWAGQWLFVDGRFSRSMMKKSRPSTLFNPPKAGEAIGYASASGHYVLEGQAITMYLDIVEHPQNIGYPDYLQYRLDGDTLILTRKWSPNRHTDSEGQSVLVLRRIK